MMYNVYYIRYIRSKSIAAASFAKLFEIETKSDLNNGIQYLKKKKWIMFYIL